MKVMKFGGSSLSTPERLRGVASIVTEAAAADHVVVVVSAFQGVTNALLDCARLAERGNGDHRKAFRALATRHTKAIDDLLSGPAARKAHAEAQPLLTDLEGILKGISLLRDAHPRALDMVASFGERLSSVILAAYLDRSWPAVAVDTRELIVTDDRFMAATVLFEPTNRKIARALRKPSTRRGRSVIPVVTGFIGATADGRTTTIGRNGSDYTASIVGGALGARSIEIWTDVDGILSADPRVVPGAFVIPRVSYEEAMELSYFGAKVLHSAAIAPAVARNIPLVIRNTFNPKAPGTVISSRPSPSTREEGVARGITSVDGITLLTLRGMSMVGVPGSSERLFRALARDGVNVILISQASSEHTICLAVTTEDASRAREALRREFQYEFAGGLTVLDEAPGQTIVAIVGDGMRGTPGVAGKVFDGLGRHGVSISAIAQGASERNISFVIDSARTVRALNVVHEAFFEKRVKLALVVVGVGNIGAALLSQLRSQRESLLKIGFDVTVCGVANSRRLAFDPRGLDLSTWPRSLENSTVPMSPARLADLTAGLPVSNVALVDCTASSEVVEAYPDYVRANMHIITPNKRANVLPSREYDDLVELMRQKQKHFLYEANVGAGLPVISTVRDLVVSGDTIERIEGLLSGTLSYLFNNFDGSRPFSECVRDAHRLGYTEPDPRDDLSGKDVARKLLILARQLGWRMSLADITVENLVPPALRKGPLPKDFYERLARHDDAWQNRLKAASARGARLRYAGRLAAGKAVAGLMDAPAGHPFAGSRGSDNIIAFTTARYAITPLVIQGPGAGAEVTAMGVFSDIVKLLHYLPR